MTRTPRPLAVLALAASGAVWALGACVPSDVDPTAAAPSSAVPAGWPDTLAAPFVALERLRHAPPDSGLVNTRGRMLGVDRCPPCPLGAECEMCTEGLVFASDSGLVRVDVPYERTAAGRALVPDRTYALTVWRSPYEPAWASEAWAARLVPARPQTLGLQAVGLRGAAP